MVYGVLQGAILGPYSILVNELNIAKYWLMPW